jgi:hypothetical protein
MNAGGRPPPPTAQQNKGPYFFFFLAAFFFAIEVSPPFVCHSPQQGGYFFLPFFTAFLLVPFFTAFFFMGEAHPPLGRPIGGA